MSRPLEPEVDVSTARDTWPARTVAFLHRRRWPLVACLLAVAVGVGTFARNIEVDNSLEVWFVEGDPALEAYERYKQTFGNDEVIIVAATDDESVYRAEALERIRAASLALEAHPKIRRVTSLALGVYAEGVSEDELDVEIDPAIENAEVDDGGIDVDTLLPREDPITEEMAAELRAKLESDPIFRGTIVGDNETMTLILVEPKTFDDFDAERPKILEDVRAIVRHELERDGGGAHLGGIGVVYEGLNAASMRDSGIFVSLSYLVVLLGLWFLFRRVVWVVVGLGAVTVAIVATMGIAGLAGRDMNMVTAVLPTLIMTVGILDLVHIVDAYDEGVAEGVAPTRILSTAVAVVVVPCVFNSVTDAIGFAALTSAKMGAIRDLGWLASVGLVILTVTILVFSIPALARFGGRKPTAARASRRLDGVLAACHRVATRRRGLVLAGALACAAFAAAGIARVTVDTYTIGFLDEDSTVRVDHLAIEEGFGPYIPLEFTVTTAEDDGLKDPQTLGAIDAMERAFEDNPKVARATGLPEIVKRSHQVWFDEAPEAYRIPSDPLAVGELLFTYSMQTEGRDHLDSIVDASSWRATHVTARSGLPSARGIQATIEDLEARAAETVGDAAEVRAAGYLPLYVRIIQHITDAQVTSFAIAFGFVTLVLMLLLRSVRLGLIAMVPNVLPAAMTLGFMGFAGIRLDVATVLIAAIAIGISVNDTSHIMFRFKHELAKTPDDPDGAVRRMLAGAGRAVVASSLILIAGFAVLLFASVKSISYFGLLSSATILSALLADLIVTPAILVTVFRRSSVAATRSSDR